MISKHLHPNDKVRVLEDLYDFHSSLLSVTANSLGRIISFEEYCDYIQSKFGGKDTPAERTKQFLEAAKATQDGNAFIVKVESYAPFSDTSSRYIFNARILEEVVLIGPQYLEKLE